MEKDINKLTRKELAEELYKAKKRLGENITPIGRKTPLSKQEFTKRYLNGVGGTKGFKKAELISLLESRLKKQKTTKSTGNTPKTVKRISSTNKSGQTVKASTKPIDKVVFSRKVTKTTINNKPQKYKVNFVENQNIDWDLAEKNEKINGKNAKNPKRKDKYGNVLLSDEAFKIGVKAGKSYFDYMKKYDDLSSLKRNNVFLGYMGEIIDNAIINHGFEPNLDITNQDLNEIIGNVIGEEVDMDKYDRRESNGFTGRKYIGYRPK